MLRLAVVLAGAAVLATGACASAQRLSIGGRTIRVTWAHLELFDEITGGEGSTMRCPVTLEGSFHSATIRKTRGALIGHVTRASIPSGHCTNGNATVLIETLPWHLTYEGFEGALPTISRLLFLLTGLSVQTNLGGLNCLWQTEVNQNLTLYASLTASGTITTIEIAANSFPVSGEMGFCSFFRIGVLPSISRVTQLGSATFVSVRLI